MKILQLVTERQYRGAEVFAANLSTELIQLGHEIFFVGLYENKKDILTVPEAENIDLGGAKTGPFSLSLVRSLVSLIQRTKPDVIQCNGSDTLKYMGVASFFVPETPIIYRNISMISEWIPDSKKKAVYKFLFKRIAHVSSVGEEALVDFIKTFNYPGNQTSVIRRGIPLKELDREEYVRLLKKNLSLTDSDKIAIHIGNFSPEKNHQFLLDLFSEIKAENPRIKLVCVGNGELFESVEREIKARGLGDTVFLLGFRSDIPELLAGSDCFVLSSKVEGVPGVVLEAASQGVPSVATNVGGVSEVLLDGETGYLINNFDRENFKNKLLHLLLNEDVRKRFGQKAYELVFREYNPAKNAVKFEELYSSLAKVKAPGKELRILQLIQKKQYRGAEVFSCQLSNHLVDLGQEVEVLSVFDGEASLPFKGKIRTLNRTSRHRYWDFQGWKNLAEYIETYKPDIVQANAADTLKYSVFSKFFFKWDAPILYRNASTASFYIRNRLAKRINSFLLSKVDCIVSVSHSSKRDLNKLYPFTRSKSLVIPVGIEPEPTDEILLLPGKKNILHIGSFTKEKNHIGLLNIFREVLKKEPEVILHLVGEGPLKGKIEALVNEYGLGKNIKFWHGLEHPTKIIKAADILVLPSIIEGLPGVLLEAMGSKTPVIAYNVGGVSEVINKATGSLIPRGNEKEFAEAIIKNLEKPEVLETENAYHLVTTQYTNQNISSRFLSVYRNLVS